jgi:hypothetical protein
LLLLEAVGVEVGEVGADEFFLGVAFGVGHEGDLGGEAVAEGVAAGAVFAFFGAGAGGFLGVAAVGGDLGGSIFRINVLFGFWGGDIGGNGECQRARCGPSFSRW